MSGPLEPDKRTRRLILDEVADLIDEFLDTLDDVPVLGDRIEPSDAEILSAPPPEHGTDLTDVLARVLVANRSGAMHPSGGHMAYIPNGGLYTGAVGAFLGAAINRYTGVDEAAPGFARLESSVIRWLEDLFELPSDSAGGVLLSGGSMANFTAIVAARTARLPADFSAATLYVTPQVHHSISKAARLAGFGASQIRTVDVDGELRMNVEALTSMIASDRRQGRNPFLVVGSAGTTNTGAVDPLADLATVCNENGIWFHADAAYGGFFQLTERGRKRLVGIGAADSITLDPHKGLSIPFGVGAVLVREQRTLTDAYEDGGAYLQDHEHADLDFSALGPELTRPMRGLHVWLPLHLHGVGAFRHELDEALDLAEHAYHRLSDLPWIERLWRPDLSIVAFRATDDDAAREALDAVNASGRVAISSTTIQDRYTMRLAILNRRTDRSHVDHAIDVLASSMT